MKTNTTTAVDRDAEPVTMFALRCGYKASKTKVEEREVEAPEVSPEARPRLVALRDRLFAVLDEAGYLVEELETIRGGPDGFGPDVDLGLGSAADEELGVVEFALRRACKRLRVARWAAETVASPTYDLRAEVSR